MSNAITIQITLPSKLMDLLERFVMAQEKIADLYAGLDDAMSPPEPISSPSAPARQASVSAVQPVVLPDLPADSSPAEKLGANVWTETRVALLRQDFKPGRSRVEYEELLRDINLCPGRRIEVVEALLLKARDLGLINGVRVATSKPQAAVPVDASRKTVLKWTEQRLLLLETDWRKAKTEAQKAALLNRVNALPGDFVQNVAAMMAKVYSLGWHKLPAPAADKVQPIAKPVATPSSSPSNPATLGFSKPKSAAAPGPKPPAPESAWDNTRKEYLQRAWPRGDDVEFIRTTLNRFPGPALSSNDIIRKAGAMMLLRPPLHPPSVT